MTEEEYTMDSLEMNKMIVSMNDQRISEQNASIRERELLQSKINHEQAESLLGFSLDTQRNSLLSGLNSPKIGTQIFGRGFNL